MPTLESLTTEDQRTLRCAPLWMLHLVGGADGKVDKKEWEALRFALRREGPLDIGLVGQVFGAVSENYEKMDEETLNAGIPAIDGLSSTGQLLDRACSPGESQHFKEALLALGSAVAEASGGVLGVGSKICGAERQAIRAAAKALGIASKRALAAGQPTFSHLLVPLDGSPQSEAALKPACDIADKFGAKVTLVEVTTGFNSMMRIASVDGFVSPGAVNAMVEAGEAEANTAVSYLDAIRTAVGKPEWTTIVVEGDPATVILDQVQACGADAIVMATAGSTGLKRIFESKVTEDVIRKANVPVLVVHVADEDDF